MLVNKEVYLENVLRIKKLFEEGGYVITFWEPPLHEGPGEYVNIIF